jgi:hypothetical protein
MVLTRNQQSMADIESQLETKLSSQIDQKMMQLATTMQESLSAALSRKMEDLFKTRHDSGSHSPSFSRNSNGNKGSNQYSCGTRLARIDFPRLNGENINQWMYQCENYFLIDATPDDVKVRFVIVHLEGKALEWHTAISKNLVNQQLSWEEYEKMLHDRFGDACDDPMAELMKR